MKKILKAYLTGFAIVFLSFLMIFMMGSCDTGTTGATSTNSQTTTDPDPVDPPNPEDEPNYWVVGEWSYSADSFKRFRFYDDYTWERFDNITVPATDLGHGTYTIVDNPNVVDGKGISLIDTLNSDTGIYWYTLDPIVGTISVNMYLDAEWTVPDDNFRYGYIGYGHWPE